MTQLGPSLFVATVQPVEEAPTHNIAGLHSLQSIQNLWTKRPQFAQPICSRNDYDNRHTGCLDVLLEFDILIDRQKGFEAVRQHES
jgi:hypothetical protein